MREGESRELRHSGIVSCGEDRRRRQALVRIVAGSAVRAAGEQEMRNEKEREKKRKEKERKIQSDHDHCAHPNFVSSRHACARLNATRLGSVHLPGDARRTHVRRSRHYLFTT
ncbi:hypothetical protein CRG98_014953 [Punica granatum]|uniref:Uncharacterized protein n=1 Tax=Punica granatum TaxID=22663 RepID=A0A2I0K7Z8_PUNGR|nr:hypothetical protein CRG98_014953 [Punica granatum]